MIHHPFPSAGSRARHAPTRRAFLYSLGASVGSLAFTSLLAAEEKKNPLAPRAGHFPAKAKNVIFLMMDGGPSHIDTFDPKPKLAGMHLQEFVREGKQKSAMESGKRYHMGEHSWWGGKHNNYEGATRTLLLCAVTGQKTAGQSTRGLVEYVDIHPTLTELCGLPPPKDAAQLEGTSFAPLFANPQQPWKKAAFSEYPKGGPDADGNQARFHGTAMRTDRYRYVEWKDAAGKTAARELYDHQTDPQENENAAARPEQAALLDQLAAQMSAGWKSARP